MLATRGSRTGTLESAEPCVTCRDGDSGHGFSVSYEAYKLFRPLPA